MGAKIVARTKRLESGIRGVALTVSVAVLSLKMPLLAQIASLP